MADSSYTALASFSFQANGPYQRIYWISEGKLWQKQGNKYWGPPTAILDISAAQPSPASLTVDAGISTRENVVLYFLGISETSGGGAAFFEIDVPLEGSPNLYQLPFNSQPGAPQGQ